MTAVLYETDGSVGLITLDRPNQLNAIDDEVIGDLGDIVDRIESEPETRAIVVTGTGRAFCAGADIAYMQTLDDERGFLAYIERIGAVFDRIAGLATPTIAAINGMAFGGGFELALCCDLRIISESASVGLPEIKIGVLPGAGGTQRLPRIVPDAVAKWLILTGDPLPAADALRLGVVNDAVATADVVDVSMTLAADLANKAPLAVTAAKDLIGAAHRTELADGLALERGAVARLFGSEDRVEGMSAFLEKRTPTFGGR